MRKSQNVFKRKKIVVILERENAIIIILKNTIQTNVESQRNHNRLLEQKEN